MYVLARARIDQRNCLNQAGEGGLITGPTVRLWPTKIHNEFVSRCRITSGVLDHWWQEKQVATVQGQAMCGGQCFMKGRQVNFASGIDCCEIFVNPGFPKRSAILIRAAMRRYPALIHSMMR